MLRVLLWGGGGGLGCEAPSSSSRDNTLTLQTIVEGREFYDLFKTPPPKKIEIFFLIKVI